MSRLDHPSMTTALEDPDQTDSEDLSHWVCCEHPDRSLCGSPLGDRTVELPDDEDPDCVVCDDLVTATVCPVYRTCRREP